MAEESKGSAASEATKSGLVTLVVGTNNSGKTILLERIANIPRLVATPGGATRSPTQRGVKFAVKYNMETCTAKLNSPAIQDSGFQYEYLVSQETEASEAARAMIGNAFRATEPCVLTGGDGDLGVKIQRSEATFAVPQWTKRASLFFDDDALQRLDTAKATFSKRHDAYLRQVFTITNRMKLTKAWFREILSKQLEARPPYDANRDWVDHDGRHAARFHFAVKGLPGANDSDIEYTAQEMGMGARSLLGVLLFLDYNQGGRILCVDEPAQFLHPPQAELLGAMISKYAIDNRCHVFVSTHSLPFMRGLMGTVLCDGAAVDMVQCHDDNLGYVSVQRVKELCGYGHVVISGLLEAFSHDRVVITENYKDALVYMAAMPMVCPDADVLWLGSGGCGEARVMLQLARRLGIHAVALLDYEQLKLGGFSKMTPQCADYAEKQTRQGLPCDRPPKELKTTEHLRGRVADLLFEHQGGEKRGVQWLREYIVSYRHKEYLHGLFTLLAQVAAETAGGIAIVPFGALEQMVNAGASKKSPAEGWGYAQHIGCLKQKLDRCSVLLRKVLDKTQHHSGRADGCRSLQPADLQKAEFAALYPQIACMVRMVMWVTSPDRRDAYAAVQDAMTGTRHRCEATWAAAERTELHRGLVEECLGGSFVKFAQSNPSRWLLRPRDGAAALRTADKRAAELGRIGQVEEVFETLLLPQYTAEEVTSRLCLDRRCTHFECAARWTCFECAARGTCFECAARWA